MPSSLTKKNSEHSLWFVFLYAVALSASGVFLGVIYLMSFPLEAYSSLDERAAAMEGRESLDPIPGDAFYIEGPTLRTGTWGVKREQLFNASSQRIRVTPGEVNAWFEAKLRSAAPTTEEEKSDLTLVPEEPNLGISKEGVIYLNLPANISGYGMNGDYVLSAQVRFAKGSPAKLKVEHLQIAGAAIPFPSLLGSQIVSNIIKGFNSAEEYALFSEAWKRVESVEVEGDALVLTLNTP